MNCLLALLFRLLKSLLKNGPPKKVNGLLSSDSLLTDGPVEQTEDEREDDKDGVPLVLFQIHQGVHPEKDEDDRLADAAEHLQEVLDGGVRLL